MAHEELTRFEERVLEFLEDHGESPPRTVEREAVDPSDEVREAIGSLESRDLIRREGGRGLPLRFLTEKGRRALA